MRHSRRAWHGKLAGGLLLAVLPLALAAVDSREQPAPREFSRSFDTRAVRHSFSAGLSEAGGGTYELRIRLSTELEGRAVGQGRNPRAGLVNGYIALALPPQWEAADDLRLYYLDSAGREQFMYSTGYPRLPRYDSLRSEPDFKTAGSEALFRYLRAASQLLDPAAQPVLPADIALRRNAGAVHGPLLHSAWLIPVSLNQTRLLNLFDAETHGPAPQIVAKLRLRPAGNFRSDIVQQDGNGSSIKLYAGALSIAAAVVDAPASLAPPGAILLSELDPQRYPVPPPSEPAVESATAQDPPQPLLVYSGEWLSWESSISLPAAELPDGTAADPRLLPRVNPDTIPQASAAPAAGSRAHEVQPVEAGEEAAPSRPPLTSSSTARQVEIGTLPAADADDEVPLRPITGSAGVRASASSGTGAFGTASQGATLPPLTGYPGSAPGSTLFYGPGGPPNIHGGGMAPPPLAAPGLGTMVLIPAGEFLMGTDAGTPYGDPDELPQHSVYLPDYYIDKYPVTNRQFGEFVVLAGHKPEGDWQRYSSPSQLDMPVRNVSWNDANAYARWAGKRLPTEAEWEKAARGTDGRLFPWGDNWAADILPRGELGYQLLVAPKAMSPYGALAMVGVLWQWTATPFHDYPFNADARGDKLVLRGGAYSNGRNIVRCANRYFEPRQMALNTFSFRCVKDKP